MNTSKLLTLLTAVALGAALIGLTAETAVKPARLKVTPVVEPVVEINATGVQSPVRSPADFCDGEWHGSAAFSINGWFSGNEYYAVYQDPTETGCGSTYPFGITAVVWMVSTPDSLTVEMQPLVYEYTVPDSIGAPLCSGPVYSVHFPMAALWTVSLSLGDTCCVCGPYYAGVYCPADIGPGKMEIVTDDGLAVPYRSDASYNDYGAGWKDLVDEGGFTWNLKLWSEGYNSTQNLCEGLIVYPGVDLWETPNDSASVDSYLVDSPVPADFFGPGSDPFDGIIYFEGSPLPTTPPGVLGPTDVIIQRFEPAVLQCPGSAVKIPVQMIALSLVSTAPITVTYNGGQDPEGWQVNLCLSSSIAQDFGSMVITRDCDSGGSFWADVPVVSRLVFTRVNPPDGQMAILDPYRVFDDWEFLNGRWATFVPPPFSVFTSPGLLTVDHDCHPMTPQVPVDSSNTNYYAGFTLEPCDTAYSGPYICGGKVLTVAREPAAIHRMLPPQASSPVEGACCLPDGSCILADLLCCRALSGVYKGDYTNCYPYPCPCCNGDGMRGNVDGVTGPAGEVDVADLTYLVAYLFQGGSVPPCEDEANVDAIVGPGGPIDVADLTYLVAYLFQGGALPAPCP